MSFWKKLFGGSPKPKQKEDFFYYKGCWVPRSWLDAQGIPHSEKGKTEDELRKSGQID
jgi:hypothetical protein